MFTSLLVRSGDCPTRPQNHVITAVNDFVYPPVTILGRKIILPVAATTRELSRNFDALLAVFYVQRMYALSLYVHAATNALVPVFLHIPPVHARRLWKMEHHTILVQSGHCSLVVPFDDSCTHFVTKTISPLCFCNVYLEGDELVTRLSSNSELLKLSWGPTELQSLLQEMSYGVLHSDKSRKCLESRLI